MGPLCALCLPGLVKISGECQECKDDPGVISLAAFIGVVLIPVAIFMTIEKTTGRNYFSMFGGVSTLTAIRDGKLRAQGAFMCTGGLL